jgi:hypothetical protein
VPRSSSVAFFYGGCMSENQSVSVHVTAIATGYYKGRVIRPGEKFLFEGNLNNGKFPLWVKTPEEYKAAKKASKKAEKQSEVTNLV